MILFGRILKAYIIERLTALRVVLTDCKYMQCTARHPLPFLLGTLSFFAC